MAAVPESLTLKIIWDKKVEPVFQECFESSRDFLLLAQCVQEALRSYDHLLIENFSLKEFTVFWIPSMILGPYNCMGLIFATDFKLDFISGMLIISIILF